MEMTSDAQILSSPAFQAAAKSRYTALFQIGSSMKSVIIYIPSITEFPVTTMTTRRILPASHHTLPRTTTCHIALASVPATLTKANA